MKVLVTGGTGHLGRAVRRGLLSQGHQARVLAREPGTDAGVEWVRGDLSTGAGVVDAVTGVDAIVHAATNSPAARRGSFRPLDLVRSPTDVDIGGTSALLAAAEHSGVGHFVHVSIVGLPQMARINPYSRVKLAAEEIVRESGVTWSIVRASGFYWLLGRMLDKMTRRRPVLLPADVHMDPIDADEFAGWVVEATTDPRPAATRDFVGPQRLTFRELAEEYLTVRGLDRRIRNAPLPRRVRSALDAGNTSDGALRATTTWAQWLRHRDL